MTISEAFAVFNTYYLINEDKSEKTRKEYHGYFHGKNGLISVVGDLPIDGLGIDHIITWKIHMRQDGLKPRTINSRLSGTRWFLKWLGENEFRVIDWKKVTFDKEELNKPHTTLTPDEVDKLVNGARTLRDKSIIKLFFGTGVRSAELIGLDRDQWEAAEIINHKEIVERGDEAIWEIYVLGKNQKYRPVCLFQNVKDAVDAYLGTRTDRFKPLFISEQNRRVHPNTIGRMLHKLSADVGLTKVVTQHVFRHSYVTEKAAEGMPTPLLSFNIGHTNEATTQKIYTHINQLHVRKAFANQRPSGYTELVPKS